VLHSTGETHQREHYYACPKCKSKFLMGWASEGAVA